MNLSVLRVNLRNWVGITVNLYVVLVEVLLVARVFFEFFFTASNGSFFQWIYAATNVALAPFRGIFGGATGAAPSTHWNVDWPALFAMAAYPLVFYAAVSVAGWLARRK